MELTLSKEDLAKIILVWGDNMFPNQFNATRFGNEYSETFVTLYHETPEPEDDK